MLQNEEWAEDIMISALTQYKHVLKTFVSLEETGNADEEEFENYKSDALGMAGFFRFFDGFQLFGKQSPCDVAKLLEEQICGQTLDKVWRSEI